MQLLPYRYSPTSLRSSEESLRAGKTYEERMRCKAVETNIEIEIVIEIEIEIEIQTDIAIEI